MKYANINYIQLRYIRICICCLLLFFVSCKVTNTLTVKNITNDINLTVENSKLNIIYQNGKYGYANAKGKIVINPNFEMASHFSGGIACVRINNKFGYININGDFIIPPRYKFASSFIHGVAYVNWDGKWQFVNKKGEVVTPSKKSLKNMFEEYLTINDKVGIGLVEYDRFPISYPFYRLQQKHIETLLQAYDIKSEYLGGIHHMNIIVKNKDALKAMQVLWEDAVLRQYCRAFGNQLINFEVIFCNDINLVYRIVPDKDIKLNRYYKEVMKNKKELPEDLLTLLKDKKVQLLLKTYPFIKRFIKVKEVRYSDNNVMYGVYVELGKVSVAEDPQFHMHTILLGGQICKNKNKVYLLK